MSSSSCQPGFHLSVASLYVGDLCPDVNEAVLFEKFSQVGAVASVRVCRDSQSKLSLGYGYVNYYNIPDAQRAIDSFNFTTLKGKTMRIMWCQRDPSLRKSGLGNIFIKNLDPTVDHRGLQFVFAPYGKILSCKVVTDENCVSRGYGFVHFSTEEAAETAIAKVHGMVINGRKVYVSKFLAQRERAKQLFERAPRMTKLFVKGFCLDLSEQQFVELFEKYGKVISHVLMKASENKNRGYGFIEYSTSDEAANAFDNLHGRFVGLNKIYINPAREPREQVAYQRRFKMPFSLSGSPDSQNPGFNPFQHVFHSPSLTSFESTAFPPIYQSSSIILPVN